VKIIIGVLIGVIIYQGIINWIERREAKNREKELLNRIMARDYTQYTQTEAWQRVQIAPAEDEELYEEGVDVL